MLTPETYTIIFMLTVLTSSAQMLETAVLWKRSISKASQNYWRLKMYPLYRAQIPDQSDAVIFINGMLSRNLSGFLWMWKNLNWFRDSTAQADGCVQVKGGICGPKEIVLVSYWRSEEALMQYFRGKDHQTMMRFLSKNPDSLCLYNEIYRPEKAGKYIHEAQGMAKVYPSEV